MNMIGTPAPLFSASDQEGNILSLADFRGRKVVLYFYPKDNTATCTVQACNLRDNYGAFVDNGYVLLGISPDSEKSHGKFIAKHRLPFPLLVDIDAQIAEQYGVWQLKKFMGRTYMGVMRTTFVIDEAGNIARIIEQVKSSDHAAQILGE